ncbi:MAG: GntR family transcriptional regulator, partial [Collinsella sp.]|nr:GntR family transcriptional regulator [Collinsella sp.]
MPKAIYEGIYREIRSRIINGTYAFQEMLPTEAELTAEFGCTRNTVRRALSMLA